MTEHKRISELDHIADLDGTELMFGVKDGQNVRFSVADVLALIPAPEPPPPPYRLPLWVPPRPYRLPLWVPLWLVLLSLVLLFIASPAHAAHTEDAVVYDPATGEVVMIVIPADDRELTDPAFNPKGLVQQQVPHTAVPDPGNAGAMVSDAVAKARVLAPSANIAIPGEEQVTDAPAQDAPLQAQPAEQVAP